MYIFNLQVTDRNLPDPPVEQPNAFNRIHDEIKSGIAKRMLKPVVIVIEDDD